MRKKLLGLILLLPALSALAVKCPVAMVSANGDRDGFSVIFRNQTKLPIRRLEFRCTVAGKVHPGACTERNALFYPGGEYTVTYPYPAGKPRALTVTVQSAMLMDGFIWKPSKHDVCRTLRITPRNGSRQSTRRNSK